MRLTFCVLCGEDDASALEHHHYIPVSQGGTDDENNIFTICGTCHGRIHDIPRPHRLSELIKAGQQRERTVSELQDMAANKAKAAATAEERTRGAIEAERREIARLRRLAKRPTPAAITVPFSMVKTPMYGHRNLSWDGPNIRFGRRVLATVVVADDPPEMYRVYAVRTGRLSDMFNLTRARDAAAGVALRTLNNDGEKAAPGRA